MRDNKPVGNEYLVYCVVVASRAPQAGGVPRVLNTAVRDWGKKQPYRRGTRFNHDGFSSL